MNNTFERNWNEELVAYFEVQYRNLPKGLNETTNNLSHNEGRQCPSRD
jgi:hypothetical protein